MKRYYSIVNKLQLIFGELESYRSKIEENYQELES